MRRALVLLGIIGFIAIMDTSFMLGIIASYARKLGADEAQAGIIAALYSLVAIPASIVAGILVDRIGRKKMLVMGLAGDALFVYLYSLASSPLQLALYRILHAIGGSLVYPASLSMVANVSTEHNLGKSVSFFLVMVATSVAIGSFMGGVLVESYGFNYAFRILSFFLLIGLIIATFFIPNTLSTRKGSEKPPFMTTLRVHAGRIIIGALAIFSLYLAFGFVVGGLPQALEIYRGLAHESAAGLSGKFIGISSGFSIIFFLFTGWLLDAKREKLVTVTSYTALLISMLLLAVWLLEKMFLATALVMGFSIASLMTLSTWTMLRVDESIRGTSIGLQQTVNIIGTGTGATLSGLLLEAGYGSGIFMFPAAFSLIALIATLLIQKSI